MSVLTISYSADFCKRALALFDEGTLAYAVALVSLRCGSTTVGSLIQDLVPETGGVDPEQVIKLCDAKDMDGLRAAAAVMRKECTSSLALVFHPGEGVTPDEVDRFLKDDDLDGLVKRAHQIIKASALGTRYMELAGEAANARSHN